MKLDAAEFLAGYKQLWEIERVFKDLKHTLDIRPVVYHRLDESIRSHVLLCFLAMILVRTAENILDTSWYQIEKVVGSISAGLIESEKVNIWYTSDISDEAREIFTTLDIPLPNKVLETVSAEVAV